MDLKKHFAHSESFHRVTVNHFNGAHIANRLDDTDTSDTIVFREKPTTASQPPGHRERPRADDVTAWVKFQQLGCLVERWRHRRRQRRRLGRQGADPEAEDAVGRQNLGRQRCSQQPGGRESSPGRSRATPRRVAVDSLHHRRRRRRRVNAAEQLVEDGLQPELLAFYFSLRVITLEFSIFTGTSKALLAIQEVTLKSLFV